MPFNRKNRRRRAAVAPVLATLLMVAVAVAMSVIIFTWSQGFLSNTSGATGSQQGAQNQAAQSSVAVEAGVFDTTAFSATFVARNVGSVSLDLGSILVQGISANAGFRGSKTVTTGLATGIAKGDSATIVVTGLTGLSSGDVINVRLNTKVGTFASAQFTVP